MFITFEGVEGSGKTTQLRRLARRLKRAGLDPVLTREPGGTPLGDALRALLLDPASRGLAPVAELFLYAAARADHLQRVILPALAKGKLVLCDRYLDATLAYQGSGRGLSRDLILGMHSPAPLTKRPDLTVLLELPVREALRRARRRNGRGGSRERRFEDESLVFHRRVARGYGRLARAEPGRILRIDGSGSEDEVAKRIADAVEPRIARRRRRS